MGAQQQILVGRRIDVPSLEADIAFFEARLSLAEHSPDSSYQRAQVKTYQTLGELLGKTLQALRPRTPAAKTVAGQRAP